MRKTGAGEIAFGGVLAALAMVILCLGTLIPVATFICPMLCALLLAVVLGRCGRRIAWAWFGAVALLGVLLAPDKEAAAVFLFLGYYPIVKPRLDRCRLGLVWKLLLFNGATLVMYALLIFVLGMADIARELREAGAVLCAGMLILGNVTFFLLDRLLGMARKKFK